MPRRVALPILALRASADTRARLSRCCLYLSHLNRASTAEDAASLALRRLERWAVRELLRARAAGRISMTPAEIRALVPAPKVKGEKFTGPPEKSCPVREYEP